MKVKQFSNVFKDVKVAQGVNISDHRGTLKKTMYSEILTELMGSIKEVLCTNSLEHVIRGMHFQLEPRAIKKFITCVNGEITDVFLDIRKNSETYGKVGSIDLSQKDNLAILIPEGFAHGFITRSQFSTVVYLQSNNYDPNFDRSINPLSIDFNWECSMPILSEKDEKSLDFHKF